MMDLLRAETTSESQAAIAIGRPEEVKTSVEKFVKAVKRKNSYGKLPLGSTTDGKPLDGLGGGFYDHGPDELGLPQVERDVARIQSILYRKQYRLHRLQEQMKFHLVSVAPSESNRSNMVLTIRFFSR